MQTIEQATTTELRTLVDFSRAMVVKAQEEADAYETEALAASGIAYNIPDSTPRAWRQIIAYAELGSSKIEVFASPSWSYRPASSQRSTIAIDDTGGLWIYTTSGSWLNLATGRLLTALPGPWPVVETPAGESFIDTSHARVLVPVMVWEDQTTGDISTMGPGSGSEFVITESGAVRPPRPPGLSDVIPTPQEYVAIKLMLAGGDLDAAQRAAYQQAVADFETPGMWEDTRQPIFASDSNGRVLMDADDFPIRNPLRIVEVKYRGELNTYYRRLVRDYGISPFESRTAEQFEVIRWTTVNGMTSSEARRFIALYAESTRVFKTAFYNQALEGEALYFRYCRLFIAWMTINRSVTDRMTALTDVDRMDDREMTNLLYSYGIYQFDDIPLAYRRRLAKNLESILSHKGTTKAFREILDLFGLSGSMTVWKHYLVRFFPHNIINLHFPRAAVIGEELRVTLSDRSVVRAEFAGSPVETLRVLGRALVESGHFAYAIPAADSLTLKLQRNVDDKVVITVSNFGIYYISSGAIMIAGSIEVGDVDYTLPEVGFQKAKIDDPLAETTVSNIDPAQIDDYEAFVGNDPTWETSLSDARAAAFSTIQTKYFSITTALNSVENGMALSVFWNILKDAQARGRGGVLEVPGASDLGDVKRMTLFESFVAVLILTLWRFNVEDIIPHGESGVATILAARTDGAPFPNEGSLLPFSTRLGRVADLPDPLSPTMLTQDVLEANLDISRKIETAINQTGREKVFDGYDPLLGGEESRSFDRNLKLRKMWDHKFISTLQTAAFGSHSTYSSWLSAANPELMNWVTQQDTTDNHVEAIITMTAIIEDYVRSDALNLTAAFGTDDMITLYAERMIRFFKAYTTDLKEFAVYYLVDRPATETLRLMNLLAEMRTKSSVADGIAWKDTLATLARVAAPRESVRLQESADMRSVDSATDILTLLDELLERRTVLPVREAPLLQEAAWSAIRLTPPRDVLRALDRAAAIARLKLEQDDVAVSDSNARRSVENVASPAPKFGDSIALRASVTGADRLSVRPRTGTGPTAVLGGELMPAEVGPLEVIADLDVAVLEESLPVLSLEPASVVPLFPTSREVRRHFSDGAVVVLY